jgi:hypothetical protein
VNVYWYPSGFSTGTTQTSWPSSIPAGAESASQRISLIAISVETHSRA